MRGVLIMTSHPNESKWKVPARMVTGDKRIAKGAVAE